MHRHARQIQIMRHLCDPVGAFGKGGVETMHKDHRLSLTGAQSPAKVRLKCRLRGKRFGPCGHELLMRIGRARLWRPSNLSPGAVGRYRHIIARKAKCLRPFCLPRGITAPGGANENLPHIANRCRARINHNRPARRASGRHHDQKNNHKARHNSPLAGSALTEHNATDRQTVQARRHVLRQTLHPPALHRPRGRVR